MVSVGCNWTVASSPFEMEVPSCSHPWSVTGSVLGPIQFVLYAADIAAAAALVQTYRLIPHLNADDIRI
jgi:hypothetical protein